MRKTVELTGTVRFSTVLCRDVQNYIRGNLRFVVVEIGAFLIAGMTAKLQLPTDCLQYGILDGFILIFRGAYPFTETQGDFFQLPLAWFILLYLCVYTSISSPVKDIGGFGIQVLLRTDSRKKWWFSKCVSLILWNIGYFFIGFSTVFVFQMLDSGEKIEWASKAFPLWDISIGKAVLLCLLPALFGILLSMVCLYASIFISLAWGQIISIAALIIIAFTETPLSFGSYSMTIRCSAVTPGGLVEWRGIVLYGFLILAIILLGQISVTHKDYLSRSEANIYES